MLKRFACLFELSVWATGHEAATSRMLNLFTASGHFNYAKSTRLYLQMIKELPDTHPWLNEQFAINSFQSVRRSDRAWAGVWMDLAIEQIPKRALKSCGGLTWGRGFTEYVCLTWIHIMHHSAGVHHAISIQASSMWKWVSHIWSAICKIKRKLLQGSRVIILFCAKVSCCVVSFLVSLLWKVMALTVMMRKPLVQKYSSKWLAKFLQIFNWRKKTQ